MEDPLALAKEFIANGVPCFVARPVPPNYIGRSEFMLPKGWPWLDPDERHLEGWSRRWAVCAVTGIGFDVMDIDPRNGANAAMNVLEGNNLLPPIKGEVKTPSGGRHLYIDRTTLRKFTPWNGIDIQAGDDGANGRGFVYIPPTIRVSKVDGRLKRYRLVQDIDWPSLGTYTEQFTEFFKILYQYYKPTQAEQRTTRALNETPSELTKHQIIVVKRRLKIMHETIANASIGNRDTLLNKYAYVLGGYVTGVGLPEETARFILNDATAQWDETSEDRINWIEYKINRGIEQGKKYPLVIFDEYGNEIKDARPSQEDRRDNDRDRT